MRKNRSQKENILWEVFYLEIWTGKLCHDRTEKEMRVIWGEALARNCDIPEL